MNIRLHKKDKMIKGQVKLPSSKSISNRALIIQALCEQPFQVQNLASAKDTHDLQNLLKFKTKELDAGAGGTTFRFLTAYLAQKEGEWILTGTERMQERPIEPLVRVLRALGADIKYLRKDGFPPLQITGKKLKSASVSISADMSSQFTSALLLIAPVIEGGLRISLKGTAVSKPYILMTLKMMQHFGVQHSWEGSTIIVQQQPYIPKNYFVEADWSAASYFYSMAALADEADLMLYGLRRDSFQGDSKIEDIMAPLGVNTKHHLTESYNEDGVHLTKTAPTAFNVQYDFTDQPDLVQTMAVCCAGLGIPAVFSGVENLRIKETDRLAALKKELKKLHVNFFEENSKWYLKGKADIGPMSAAVSTYDDHRMAMAFAPLALLTPVTIENPEVVEKSYPGFWDDLKALGFEVEEM